MALHPGTYVKRFRLIAALSVIGFAVISIVLMLLSTVPKHEIVPFVALVVGAVPVLIFKLFNKVQCPRCKHKMKIFSRFPHVIYKCTRCSHVVNTTVYSDF
jgi:hypothetical protein